MIRAVLLGVLLVACAPVIDGLKLITPKGAPQPLSCATTIVSCLAAEVLACMPRASDGHVEIPPPEVKP